MKPRRTFLLQSSAVLTAMAGGCSRDPVSAKDLEHLVDLSGDLFTQTRDSLDNLSDTLARHLDEPVRDTGEGEGPTGGQAAASEKPHADEEERKSIPGDVRSAYTAFIEGLELRYIRPDEIIRAHTKCRDGVSNCLPPEKLWKKMAPTLKVADEIRHRLGKRMLCVYSAYRSPDYNAKCPGASPKSYHMKNCALDLRYDCSPGEVSEVAKKLRAEKFFKGGIGVYSSFVHVDTRGYNASWDSTPKSKRPPKEEAKAA